MSTHRPHPIRGAWPEGNGHKVTVIYDDPADALLYDNCPRCTEQAENPLFLDHHKLRAAWDRMCQVERGDGHYRTVNERKVCVALYLAALTLSRLQGHGDPWRIGMAHDVP